MTVYNKMEECLAGLNLEAHSQDTNWRVRYAAAVAMGESRDAKWLDTIERVYDLESKRSLYNQPPARFPGLAADETRLSEHIGPLKAVFPIPADEETKEAWRCRGRVKQAVLYAVYDIGAVSASMLAKLHECLENATDDYCVIAAAARALGRVGNATSLEYLDKILAIDEWCTTTEAKKSIRILEHCGIK